MIILYIILWLLTGLVGSVLLFRAELYENNEYTTFCQLIYRSSLGPINLIGYVMVFVGFGIYELCKYIVANKRCTKIILKRK